MMEDSWLCVDEDSSSNESFSNSDKIDSETEAELYSLIHFEDNLSTSNYYNSKPENAQTSETLIHTSKKMKYILSTEKNKKNEEAEIVDCLKPAFQKDGRNSTEKKRPYCESLFLNELAEKLSSDKKKKTDSGPKRLGDFLKNHLDDSSCNQSYNLNKSDPSSPKCTNSLNVNSRISSESSDTDIWAEVDASNENNIQTNVHKDEDLVYISSDSEPEFLPSFEMRLSNLKNRMSMPNLTLRENSQDVWFINQEDLSRHKRGRSRRYHDNFENTCSNCNKKGHNAKICPSPRSIKCFICGGGHVGASCINRMCGKCYGIGHDAARCLQSVISHCVLCRLYGHTKENCPDLWRRYHLTTELGKIIRGKKIRQDTCLYCCNCGEIGHIGAVCQGYRGPRNCLSTLPFVVSYDNPERFLKMRLSDNSRSNATMNKKSKCQKDNKAKQAKRKQKKKGKLERFKGMLKEAVKEKDFPRTPKTNSIPNPPSDNVPAFVKKIIETRRKRREKRKLKRLAEEATPVETSKVLMLTGFGGYDKIKLLEKPKPEPKEDHLVIEIKASGMNFSDLYVRQGIYTFHGLKPPFVLGSDGAGIVSEVGKNVTDFKIGDRVLCWKFNYGTWAEFIEVHPSQCYPLPDAMTYLEATCIVTNYLTAYFAIMDFGNLRSGQNILIQSAAGGVGWAATQIARSVKDVTIFGTASSSKHELIKENGVTHAIDYQKEDFVEEILKVSPQGINVVLDCLSGVDFVRAQGCLKNMGRIIHIGISSMINGEKRNIFKNLKVWWQTKNISIYNLIQKNQAVCGLAINQIFENDPALFKSALQNVIQLYVDGKIKPRIDSVWSFDEVVEATKCMVERKNVGKIVLVPKKEDSKQFHESFQN